MDLSETIAPTSDQLDAVDLLTGPRTFTIEKVTKGNAEQPVQIYLAEFDRPWRPGKSMRRVLVAAWGADGASYVGKRLTLWCDPSVQFGGAAVGGVRITHMSDLDKKKTIPLLVTRGRSAPYTVQPLTEEAPKRAEKSLQHRIAEAISAFAAVGVDVAQLEASVGKQPGDWQADDLNELVEVYKAIKGGQVTVDEAFPPAGRTVDPKPATDPVEEPPGWES